MTRRLMLAMLIAFIAGGLCYAGYSRTSDEPVDVMWSILAARDLLHGRDPYRWEPHAFLVPYPLTAALLGLPFAGFPLRLGAALFFGISSGLLAFGLLRDGQLWRLMVFLSAPFLMALLSVQWSPLLYAALLLPALAPIAVCKPTIGAVVFLQRFSRAGLLVAGLWIGISLWMMPDWPLRWLPQTRAYAGFVPLLTLPCGPLLLLAWLRRNDPRARHVLLLSMAPQFFYFYDALLLWHVPQSRRSMLWLTLNSWIAFGMVFVVRSWDVAPLLIVLWLYLPALAMVLWPMLQPALERRRWWFVQQRGSYRME